MSPNTAERATSLKTVSQYQSEVAALREGPEPRSALLTIHTLAAMVLAFIVVLFVGQVDRVVSTDDGQVVTEEPGKVIQALDPSIIRSIDVKEGQRVAKGQLLATLDPTFAAAVVDQLQAQIDGLTAEIARDQAEITGKPLVFPASNHANFEQYAKIQRDFYDQQIAQYKAQLNSFDQKIALTKATIAKYQADGARYKERVDIESTIEEMRSTLAQHGTGSQLNRLESSDARIDTARNMEFDQNSITENEHALASLQADREAAVQLFLTTASQDLATAQTNLGQAQAQLDAATHHKDLVGITADQDSYVLSIAKLSVGSVLKEGDTLMTLTPVSVPIVAEVKISPRDVGFVRKGDFVTLKLDPYNFQEYGTAEGTVLWISEAGFSPEQAVGALPSTDQPSQPGDAIQPAMQQTYYKVRISIDKYKFTNVPSSVRLIPGMTLTADIKVGRHSLARYILGGLIRSAGDAMREP